MSKPPEKVEPVCAWCADFGCEPVMVRHPTDPRAYRLELQPCQWCSAPAKRVPAQPMTPADAPADAPAADAD